ILLPTKDSPDVTGAQRRIGNLSVLIAAVERVFGSRHSYELRRDSGIAHHRDRITLLDRVVGVLELDVLHRVRNVDLDHRYVVAIGHSDEVSRLAKLRPSE